MSQLELPPRRGKLPPLGQEDVESVSNERTPRKKKPKVPPSEASLPSDTARSTPRKMPPRPPGSIRSGMSQSGSRNDSDMETERTERSRDIPSRPKPKRAKNINGTLENIEDELSPAETEQSQRPKKKRKPKPKVTESHEELVDNGAVSPDPTTDRSDRPKKKKKKKVGVVMPVGVGLEAELHELEEDIVSDGNDESFEENHYGTPAVMRSEPINKLFIEQKSGFKTANKDKIARKRAIMQRHAMTQVEPEQKKSTIQFAISSHRVFKTMVLFLQGLLGGICIWQVVTVYMLSNQGYDVLLAQYSKLAMPVQCMFYFLLALSTVAVFDKNDIARPNKQFVIRSATMQTTAIACFFYLAALVLNASIAYIDDKINLYPNDNQWEDDAARDKELKTWVSLNLVRGLMAILGWLVISISPTSDRLIQNLEVADENIIEGLEDIPEPETIVRTNGVV